MPWPQLRRGRTEDPALLLETAETALDDGRADEAYRSAERARRALRRIGAGAVAEAEALLLQAAALSHLGRREPALAAATTATELTPDDPEAWRLRGVAAYVLGRFEEAASHLERAVSLAPDDADAWHTLGRVRSWLDQLAAGDEALRRAAQLDPSRYPTPLRIAAGEFDRLAADVWAAIPAQFRRMLANTMLVVEPLPDPEEVEEGLDPDLLGVYTGATALHDDGPFERIVLYQRNHEVVCATLGELREEIRRTILHEVGHHFGMDEHELPY
jgi:predicted Zn-dependent protease with MMP-like domain